MAAVKDSREGGVGMGGERRLFREGVKSERQRNGKRKWGILPHKKEMLCFMGERYILGKVKYKRGTPSLLSIL